MKCFIFVLIVSSIVLLPFANAQLMEREDKTTVLDMFTERACLNGNCKTTIHNAPQRININSQWQELEHKYYINGTWIMYTDVDWDSWMWIKYVDEDDNAYVCWNISDKYKDTDLNVERGTSSYTIKLQPKTEYCNLYAIDEYPKHHFGTSSTELYIWANDTTMDGEIYELDDGTPTYTATDDGLYPYAGKWTRNISSNRWNYTYRAFYGFNTSVLPDDDTILNVSFYIRPISDDALAGNYIVYYADIGAALDSTDWSSNISQETGIMGQLADGTANMSEEIGYFLNRSYYNLPAAWVRIIDLNISNINDTGWTTYMIANEYESYAGWWPELPGNGDNEGRRIRLSETESAYDPYMIVYHEAVVGDTDPPNINWLSNETNGTEDYNITYFVWNISSNESFGDCEFEINGTNQSGTQNDDGVNSYCWYNETGFTGNVTTCAWGYGSDASSNWNRTDSYVCRDFNIHNEAFPDAVPPDVTWINPTTNGTEGVNVTFVTWNISIYDYSKNCSIEINGTNNTGTLVNASTSYCYYNETGLSGNVTTCAYGYGQDKGGNWNRTDSLICRDTNEQQPAAPDTTPGDILWINPTTNGTEAVEKDYIEWNVSLSENISECFIEINSTNYTATTTLNATGNSYCFYNQTGLSGNNTYCSYGYASEINGNFNRTLPLICRDTNISGAAVAAIVKTTCEVNPVFLFEGDIYIGWELECDDTFLGTMIYGELWNYTSAGWTFAFPEGSGVYHNLSNMTMGETNGFTSVEGVEEGGGSYLVARYGGIYRADLSLSFVGSAAGGQYGIGIVHNFDVNTHRDCYARRQGTGSVGNVGITCIMDIDAGDTVNIQIEDESNPTKSIDIYTANFNLIRIGDL